MIQYSIQLIYIYLSLHTCTAANAISTVQQYYKDLEEINADDIIGRLYSKKVISKTERDMAQAPTRLDFERMHIILKAVEGVPDKFPLFLASLGEIPKYERLAEKMQKSYSTGRHEWYTMCVRFSDE